MTRGLLPLCNWDRVLFIDVKGYDKTLRGVGKPVRHIPKVTRAVRQMMRDDEPRSNWYRLVTYDNFEAAREQVRYNFERIWQEGDWVLVIDELRAITDIRPPGLNLYPEWERFMLRGGSKGIPVINATQEPRWVRGSFYTQFSFGWISKIEDEASQKRLSEIGSSKALLPHIQRVPRHNWIYTDNLEDERFLALTKVT